MGTPSPQAVILLAILAGAGVHGLYLWWTVARRRAETDAAARALAEAQPGAGGAWVWRPIPAGCSEPKLVLAHDRTCRHQVLQYPTIQPGGHVRFAGGQVHLMTESALERTLEADDALRDRLGLEPVSADEDEG